MTEFACPDPSSDLCKKIIMRIRKEERILVFKQLIIFSVTLVASIVAFVPSTKILVSQLQSSGFVDYASLIFSDSSIILTYWKSFMMVMLQTLPAASIALFLAILLTFLQSIKSITKYARLLSVKTI